MNESIKEFRLKAIDGLVEFVETLCKRKDNEPPPSKLMLVALDAVLTNLDRHGGFDEGIGKAVALVREAYNLPEQPRTPCPTSPTTPAKSASASPMNSLDASPTPETPSSCNPPSLEAAPPSDASGQATS